MNRREIKIIKGCGNVFLLLMKAGNRVCVSDISKALCIKA